MLNMIDINKCKGCHSYHVNRKISMDRTCAAHIVLENNEECPCSDCLVKVMCQNFCLDYIVAVHTKHMIHSDNVTERLLIKRGRGIRK